MVNFVNDEDEIILVHIELERSCSINELSCIFLSFFSYRTRDEIQNVRKTQDPIASFKERILSADLVTADELKVSEMNRELIGKKGTSTTYTL